MSWLLMTPKPMGRATRVKGYPPGASGALGLPSPALEPVIVVLRQKVLFVALCTRMFPKDTGRLLFPVTPSNRWVII